MKKILLFLFLAISVNLNAESYLGMKHNNIKKPILVLVEMNNCKYCRMQKNIINNSVLREYIDKNYQYKIINMSRTPLPMELMTSQSPTMFVMTKDGKEIDKMTGLVNSEELLKRLNRSLKKIYDIDRYKL